MRDFPIFTTENGVGSLVLKEIPYRGVAYITIRDSSAPAEFLNECADFCRAVGAQHVYASGHSILESYPVYTSIVQMSASTEFIPETDAALPAHYNADTFTVSRGMVGLMADIRGVDIWANFTETENGVLCELRSSTMNINPIAVKYGGGGHAKASGATLANREEAMAMLADLDAMMEENA